MSILIKGMTMPTNCGECLLSALRMDCRLTGRDISRDWIKRKIPGWCPLVPVPPHGRLIDADALTSKLWEQRRNYQLLDDTQTSDKILYGLYRAEQIIGDMPTIIEAEGEDNG